MPVGGPISYDSFVTYLFINMVGYGHADAGYLSSYLRTPKNTPNAPLFVDLNIDFL